MRGLQLLARFGKFRLLCHVAANGRYVVIACFEVLFSFSRRFFDALYRALQESGLVPPRKHQTLSFVLQLQAASSRATLTDRLHCYPAGNITSVAVLTLNGTPRARSLAVPPRPQPNCQLLRRRVQLLDVSRLFAARLRTPCTASTHFLLSCPTISQRIFGS